MIIPKKKYALHDVELPDGRNFQLLIQREQLGKNDFCIVAEIPMKDVLKDGAENNVLMPMCCERHMDEMFSTLDKQPQYRLKLVEEVVERIEQHISQ